MGVNTTRHPASRLCRSVPADTRRQSRAGGRKQGMARGCRAGLWARSGLKVVRMRRSLQKSAVGMIFTSLQSDSGVCATRDADSGVQGTEPIDLGSKRMLRPADVKISLRDRPKIGCLISVEAARG